MSSYLILIRLYQHKILFFAVILFLVSLSVLLNIADPNPTGRRYSSEMPVGNSSNAKGNSAEQILANDLAMVNNNQSRQCICSLSGASSPCNSCFVQLPIQATYRLPDFVHMAFIAESKNRATMPAGDIALLQQIEDYALAAQTLNIPLWIYVRTDTQVDSIYYYLAQTTGGDVIHYFTVTGYVDQLDQFAIGGILIALGLSLVIIVVRVRS